MRSTSVEFVNTISLQCLSLGHTEKFLLRGIYGTIRWAPGRFFNILIICTRKLHFNLGFWSNFKKLKHALAEHMRR